MARRGQSISAACRRPMFGPPGTSVCADKHTCCVLELVAIRALYVIAARVARAACEEGVGVVKVWAAALHVPPWVGHYFSWRNLRICADLSPSL